MADLEMFRNETTRIMCGEISQSMVKLREISWPNQPPMVLTEYNRNANYSLKAGEVIGDDKFALTLFATYKKIR